MKEIKSSFFHLGGENFNEQFQIHFAYGQHI